MSALLLTHRTKERGARALYDAPDDAIAAGRRARFAGPVVNTKIVLEVTELAVGATMVAQRGSTGRDRGMEHGFDRFDQSLRALVRRARAAGNSRCPPFRREAGAMHRLADINVSKAGDDPLVGQRRLERRLLPF